MNNFNNLLSKIKGIIIRSGNNGNRGKSATLSDYPDTESDNEVVRVVTDPLTTNNESGNGDRVSGNYKVPDTKPDLEALTTFTSVTTTESAAAQSILYDYEERIAIMMFDGEVDEDEARERVLREVEKRDSS